jgi:hypothetical protein
MLHMIPGCPDCILQPAPYVDHGCWINQEHLADLMRLRTGAQWLHVVTRSPCYDTARGGASMVVLSVLEVMQEMCGI